MAQVLEEAKSSGGWCSGRPSPCGHSPQGHAPHAHAGARGHALPLWTCARRHLFPSVARSGRSPLNRLVRDRGFVPAAQRGPGSQSLSRSGRCLRSLQRPQTGSRLSRRWRCHQTTARDVHGSCAAFPLCFRARSTASAGSRILKSSFGVNTVKSRDI